jgi:hypothetical protein
LETVFHNALSLGQGGARTDLSYSIIIAEILEEKNYCYPLWDKGGLLLNIEVVFRKLQKRLGKIFLEWKPLVKHESFREIYINRILFFKF